jgi:hypothetical protein
MEGLVVLARLAGLSKPESVDLVQHMKVDLVQPLWPAGLRATRAEFGADFYERRLKIVSL